jgi:hypothetical protein
VARAAATAVVMAVVKAVAKVGVAKEGETW